MINIKERTSKVFVSLAFCIRRTHLTGRKPRLWEVEESLKAVDKMKQRWQSILLDEGLISFSCCSFNIALETPHSASSCKGVLSVDLTSRIPSIRFWLIPLIFDTTCDACWGSVWANNPPPLYRMEMGFNAGFVKQRLMDSTPKVQSLHLGHVEATKDIS